MMARIGLGWRPELSAGILANLERIDVLEILADDEFDAVPQRLRSLNLLASQIPVMLHGTGMGLASSHPVDRRHLTAMARLVDRVGPEGWSEHLAFVRAGGVEIGHLAAPPRTPETLEGLVRNVEAAKTIIGSAPLLENVASLIDPPLSVMDETTWLLAVLDATGCDLLLDLHNLHANAVNFGFDAGDVIDSLPFDRVGAIHIAGGRRIRQPTGGKTRILDDHRHPVPDPVFSLLARCALISPRPLTVILERDGDYPVMTELLDELDRARFTVGDLVVEAVAR